ncbi:GNAT family N-acetyltransferase [Candidatus Gracilibacteria bacterium]|nr:GNAT family N-acetyltransferase [Candidatus Gracilibacteria bacterium]
MKLKPLKKKKTAIRFLKAIFPAWGLRAIWKLFHKEKQSKFFFQAEKNKKILGIMAISSVVFWGLRWLHLRFFVVDSKWRGKGVGTEMLENLEKKAQKTNHRFIFLTSKPFRNKAHRFYLKNGFKRVLWFFFWKKIK